MPADLVAALEEVWREHARDAEPLLRARLRVLVDRRVPVRGVRRAPGGRAARILFADGTVLVCQGHGPGDLGRLLLAARNESVRLASYSPADAGTHLSFCWAASPGVTVTAMGLDQPD